MKARMTIISGTTDIAGADFTLVESDDGNTARNLPFSIVFPLELPDFVWTAWRIDFIGDHEGSRTRQLEYPLEMCADDILRHSKGQVNLWLTRGGKNPAPPDWPHAQTLTDVGPAPARNRDIDL
jgi:hypothetical protein